MTSIFSQGRIPMSHSFLLRAALCSAICLLAMPIRAGEIDSGDIRFDAPLSGWRNSSTDTEVQNFEQEVNYPASHVNTPEGQSRMALIAGSVSGKAKVAGPYKLVVNGVAMPLKVDDAGNFSRPYAFGRGANNVEVRTPDGSARNRVQFYEAQNDKLQARLRVVLAWDADASDLDLHVIAPDGQHCWYGNRTLENGGALDIDVTDGYGPEIFASPVGQPGRYYVYVNYYGGMGSDNTGSAPAITVATVTVITDENTVDEKKQSFVVPMRRPGELTEVGSFVYALK
jgi:uncharacterized protein YfaP (DUF2135 family)